MATEEPSTLPKLRTITTKTTKELLQICFLLDQFTNLD